jgi:hypothetical protein
MIDILRYTIELRASENKAYTHSEKVAFDHACELIEKKINSSHDIIRVMQLLFDIEELLPETYMLRHSSNFMKLKKDYLDL